MKCPYCAEEIQDAAILCRFCGAKKFHQSWVPPPAPVQTTSAKPVRKFNLTSLTFKSSGVLFIASALFELLALNGEVPLLGAMRGGAVAVIYHLLYITIFVGMGIGLLQAKAWGYRVCLGGIGFYVLDKLLYLVDGKARAAELAKQTQGYGDVFRVIDRGSIELLVTVMTLTLVACWVGFGLYVHLHRDYFKT